MHVCGSSLPVSAMVIDSPELRSHWRQVPYLNSVPMLKAVTSRMSKASSAGTKEVLR